MCPRNANRTAGTAQYIKYTPAQQGAAYASGAGQRIIKMQDMPVDPLEPPKFRHTKVGCWVLGLGTCFCFGWFVGFLGTWGSTWPVGCLGPWSRELLQGAGSWGWWAQHGPVACSGGVVLACYLGLKLG